MLKTKVIYSNCFPSRTAFPNESLLLYDSVLNKNPSFKAWAKKFEFKLALKAGETLKSLKSFEEVLKKISKIDISATPQLTFIAVGGGSIGDFVGFLASVYLRGRPLISFPSTWLAAVDSAHGGKNGLNLFSQKNQLGSFYSAEKVFLIRQLLESQPKARMTEALGEVIKMAIIREPTVFKYLENKSLQLTSKNLFDLLPKTIAAKYKIVQQDPFEKKGLRRVLNLGHTLGHVFESNYGWPHGICVLVGTLFSVRWSFNLGHLPAKDYIRISNLIEEVYPQVQLSEDLKGLSATQIKTSLLKDKKRTSPSEIDFIFIKRIGAVERKKVSIESILAEVQRQKTEY